MMVGLSRRPVVVVGAGRLLQSFQSRHGRVPEKCDGALTATAPVGRRGDVLSDKQI